MDLAKNTKLRNLMLPEGGMPVRQVEWREPKQVRLRGVPKWLKTGSDQ